MLVTLLLPTGGQALVAGHDVAREPDAVRSRIGVALQEAALDPLMTGRELVELQATLHGIPAARVRERGAELIERVGLVEARDRRVGTYSGGMRRRLDLAMALIHDPEILFLDEPTTGLDPVSRQRLWEEVERLESEGTTVFLTTQYLEEADRLADRVGIINSGQLVAEGTPAALKAEVSRPRLELTLGENCDRASAVTALERFGTPLPPIDGVDVALALERGAAELAPIVRALDDAGLHVAGLEIVPPTLDDVFVQKTGRHLEGAGDGDGPAPAADALATDPPVESLPVSPDQPVRQ
jgi:ABC-2 type transport system ATP-binding protein